MPATLTLPRRVARKSPKAPARPVRELLLEIAYRLHATKPLDQVAVGGRR